MYSKVGIEYYVAERALAGIVDYAAYLFTISYQSSSRIGVQDILEFVIYLCNILQRSRGT